MLNEGRYLHTLAPKMRKLFQCGVTGNEAFHLEVKNTFAHVKMHPAVRDMKLQHLQIRKLIAHNSSLYHSTLRHMEELEVLNRRAASLKLWGSVAKEAGWFNATQYEGRGNTPQAGCSRIVQSSRLRAWTKKNKIKKVKTNAMKVQAMKVSVFRRAKKMSLLKKGN